MTDYTQIAEEVVRLGADETMYARDRLHNHAREHYAPLAAKYLEAVEATEKIRAIVAPCGEDNPDVDCSKVAAIRALLAKEPT